MHTIPASEIKRRGIAALDEALTEGPVHIVKNNRPRYVVLTEDDYHDLTAGRTELVGSPAVRERPKVFGGQKTSITLGIADGRYSIPEPDAHEDAEISRLFEAASVFP